MGHYWGTVPRSMFTLFIVMTGEGWNTIADDTMRVYSLLWLFFVPFVVCTNVMIMNLVVGVMVDKVMVASKKRDRREQLQMEPEMLKQLANMWILIERSTDDGKVFTVDIVEAFESPSMRNYLK